MESILDEYRRKIEEDIQSISSIDSIPLFYEPIKYINQLPGKRIRPLLTILSGLAVGGNLNDLLPSASAVELLHNFSLVHDDIMDDDDTRRGKPTVHVKWDIGTAILTGDGLLGLAYRKLLMSPNVDGLKVASLFTEAMLDICEGQALDKTFENTTSISENEYLEMIKKKTATLIGMACQLGAIVGHGTEEEIKSLTDFGYQMGMGFQIQDDLLDVFADEKKLGKRVGSDLAMNKKTIITIRLSEKMDKPLNEAVSISKFKELLEIYNIVVEIQSLIDDYFKRAKNLLSQIPSNKYTSHLASLADHISNREK
jgi:geranylgeranyl pyrophosphate synthase